ncbi:hypothetical protein ACQJBY_026891 [Aegilops geniculata]
MVLPQVIAFSDEEGVRFQTRFLGSAAVAGILPESTLQVSDKMLPFLHKPTGLCFETVCWCSLYVAFNFFNGTTVQEALRLNSFEASADALGQVKYGPESYSESEVQKKSSMKVKIKKERYEV